MQARLVESIPTMQGCVVELVPPARTRVVGSTQPVQAYFVESVPPA